MEETDENLNAAPELPTKSKNSGGPLGPILFFAAAILLSVGAFAGGAYFSLGQEGIAKIMENQTDEELDISYLPTHEWIEIDKTIYQLARRDEGKFVMAEFSIRVPIESAEEVKERLPELEFALQTYIRELSSRELQGAMGLYNLRNACLFRARRIMGQDAVEDILIGELLVE